MTGKRRSIRLAGRDYSQPNAYFVTVNVAQKSCLLGEVVNGEMVLNANGDIVATEWRALGSRFAAVYLDAWVVMPNHMHGIVWLRAASFGLQGAQQRAPTHSEPVELGAYRGKPLGQIIGAFKTAVTRRVNERNGIVGPSIWQRNFHEHIVRDEADLARIRSYIQLNPQKWQEDPDNPANNS